VRGFWDWFCGLLFNDNKEVVPVRSYSESFLQTPNVSSRSIKPEAIVLHHSSGSYAGGVSWCRNPKSQVSYHVLIARNGDRTVLAKDTQRAWHAGKSFWKGRSDLNSWSLGVAWEGDTSKDALGEDAIASAIEYIVPRMRKWGMTIEDVTDHRTISPGRKQDIDEKEFKKFLARLGEAL